MFDTENKFYNSHTHNHKIDITNCSGGIYKTYKESFFVRWAINSEILGSHPENTCYYNVKCKDFTRRSKTYLDEYTGVNPEPTKYKEFVILQMVIISKDYLMAEIILKEDFDRYFADTIGVKEE